MRHLEIDTEKHHHWPTQCGCDRRSHCWRCRPFGVGRLSPRERRLTVTNRRTDIAQHDVGADAGAEQRRYSLPAEYRQQGSQWLHGQVRHHLDPGCSRAGPEESDRKRCQRSRYICSSQGSSPSNNRWSPALSPRRREAGSSWQRQRHVGTVVVGQSESSDSRSDQIEDRRRDNRHITAVSHDNNDPSRDDHHVTTASHDHDDIGRRYRVLTEHQSDYRTRCAMVLSGHDNSGCSG
jgi:hypothetical protein